MPSKNSVNRAKIINTAHARQQANALRRRRHSDKALRSGIVFGKCDSKKTIRKKLRNSAYVRPITPAFCSTLFDQGDEIETDKTNWKRR